MTEPPDTMKGGYTMKNYQVKFTGFSAFTDTIIVYDVASRQEAIQAVKDHYGKQIKVISAKEIKD